jgi:hypothetical protein
MFNFIQSIDFHNILTDSVVIRRLDTEYSGDEMVIGESNEGFYLGPKGKPQDSDFFDDDEPANPKDFNREMWKWGLENGYTEDGLTHLYGPKPSDL